MFLDNFEYELGSSDDTVTTTQPGEINGRVWNDTDGDGTIDAKQAPKNAKTSAKEEYASGITLSLYRVSDDLDADQLIGTTTTSTDDMTTSSIDEGGKYGFDNLVPGFYRIDPTNPAGKVQSFPYSGQSQYVHVFSDQNVNNVSFGFYDSTPGNASGKVWNDVNENQQIDNGELGIANATVCNWQVWECKKSL